MGDEGMVSIPLERYEELIDIETKAKVIVDMLIYRKYISTEDILRIIGTEEAIEEADNVRSKMEWIERNAEV